MHSKYNKKKNVKGAIDFEGEKKQPKQGQSSSLQ
jgi:hypothetical protein